MENNKNFFKETTKATSKDIKKLTIMLYSKKTGIIQKMNNSCF